MDLMMDAAAASAALKATYSACQMMNAWAYSLLETHLVPTDPRPAWFDGVVDSLNEARTPASRWVSALGPACAARMPQTLIDYCNDLIALAPSLAAEATRPAALHALLENARRQRTKAEGLQASIASMHGAITAVEKSVNRAIDAAAQVVIDDSAQVAVLAAAIAQLHRDLGEGADPDATADGALFGNGKRFFILYVTIPYAKQGIVAYQDAMLGFGAGMISSGYISLRGKIADAKLTARIAALGALQTAMTVEQQQLAAAKAILETLRELSERGAAALTSVASLVPLWSALEASLQAADASSVADVAAAQSLIDAATNVQNALFLPMPRVDAVALAAQSAGLTPQVDAMQDAMTDLTNAAALVTSHSHAVFKVNLERVSPPPPWFLKLDKALETARDHAQTWIGDLGPEIGAAVHETIHSYHTTFEVVSEQLQAELQGAHDPARIAGHLKVLLKHLRHGRNGIIELHGKVRLFMLALIDDQAAFREGADSAQQVIETDQQLIAEILAKMRIVSLQLARDSARISSGLLRLGIGMFINLVRVAIGAGGSAYAPVLSIGSFVKDMADSHDVEEERRQLFNLQAALEFEQHQVVVLEAIVNSVDGLVLQNEVAQRAITGVLSMWEVVEAKLEMLIEDLASSQTDSGALAAADLQQAALAWAQLLAFAGKMAGTLASLPAGLVGAPASFRASLLMKAAAGEHSGAATKTAFDNLAAAVASIRAYARGIAAADVSPWYDPANPFTNMNSFHWQFPGVAEAIYDAQQHCNKFEPNVVVPIRALATAYREYGALFEEKITPVKKLVDDRTVLTPAQMTGVIGTLKELQSRLKKIEDTAATLKGNLASLDREFQDDDRKLSAARPNFENILSGLEVTLNRHAAAMNDGRKTAQDRAGARAAWDLLNKKLTSYRPLQAALRMAVPLPTAAIQAADALLLDLQILIDENQTEIENLSIVTEDKALDDEFSDDLGIAINGWRTLAADVQPFQTL